jgi:hypothetical protein
LLTVSAAETASTLTVTATSTADPSKKSAVPGRVAAMTTGVEAEPWHAMSLHPNPFTGIVHLTGAKGSVLTVFNTTGATVHTQKISNEDETISLERLPAGMYFFRLEKDGVVKTVKAVKR